MALQVWLPLNGDLNNQGLSDLQFSFISPSNTTINTSGKIGKCYNNNSNNAGGLISNKVINLGQNQSMFCWVNFTSLTSSANLGGGLVTQHRHSNNSGMGITIKYVSSTTGYLSVNTGNGSARTYNVYCATTLMNAGTWYHVGYTYDGSNIRLYVNGNCEKIQAYSGMLVPADYIGIFNWSLNNASGNEIYHGYDLNGKLNDVRIYNHCLSDKEVKELAKGLVLYYPLNQLNTNLLSQDIFSLTPWVEAIKAYEVYYDKLSFRVSNSTLYSQTGNGANNIFPNIVYEADTQYTISVDWRDDYRTDGKNSSLYLRFKYSDGTYSQIISPASSIHSWTHSKLTSTSGKTVSAVTTTYGNGGQLYLTNLKLEKGNIETPFVYNENNIIYDSSGYNHNATIIGTASIVANSPRYTQGLSMNNVSSANHIECNDEVPLLTDGITASFWVKATKATNQVIFAHPNFEFGLLNSLGYACLTSSAGFTLTNFVNNEWNHIVVIRNDSTYKLYINGIEETRNGANNYYIHNGNKMWFLNRNYNNNYAANASISDFRIYATALSEKDILELYNTSKIINGTTRIPRDLESEEASA